MPCHHRLLIQPRDARPATDRICYRPSWNRLLQAEFLPLSATVIPKRLFHFSSWHKDASLDFRFSVSEYFCILKAQCRTRRLSTVGTEHWQSSHCLDYGVN